MDLKKLIKEVLATHKIDCGCGCNNGCAKAPILNENLQSRVLMTDNMKYHIDSKKPLHETALPYGSKEYLDLWVEARYLYSRGAVDAYGIDKEKITETHLGEYGIFEGQMVPLDMPMLDEDETSDYKPQFDEKTLFDNLFIWGQEVLEKYRIYSGNDLMFAFRKEPSAITNILRIKADLPTVYAKDAEYYSKKYSKNLSEAEYQGRKVQLGKPMQGDIKKFKVYVKNDKGKVVKVNFGFGGKSAKGKRMVIKDKNPKKRAAFRARHNCKNPGPRWKARYWSCKKW